MSKKNIGFVILVGLILFCALVGIVTNINASNKKITANERIFPITDESFLRIIKPTSSDLAIGSADAAVDIIFYGSMSCYHCADFMKNHLDKIKPYTNSGKVRFVYRGVVSDKLSFMATKIVKCAKELSTDERLKLIKLLYSTQASWISSSEENTQNSLVKIVANVGISAEKSKKCLTDVFLEKDIVNEQIFISKNLNITGTPVIIVGKTRINGYVDYDVLQGVIESELNNANGVK